MNHVKLLNVLTSHPVSHVILPRVCALQRHVWQTMRHIVISEAVDRHISQPEYV